MVCAYPDGPTMERALCFGDGREEFKMDIRMQTSPAMQDEFQEVWPKNFHYFHRRYGFLNTTPPCLPSGASPSRGRWSIVQAWFVTVPVRLKETLETHPFLAR